MEKKKSIGCYRILGHIGSGGMGDVYLGEDIHLKRKVAIKALKQDLSHDLALIERFKLEATALARLNHPNVATIFTFLEEAERYYLAIEFVAGCELQKLIEKAGSLSLSAVLFLFSQILAAIGAVHEEDIVHRDIKPTNIMIDKRLRVKVMDFGIARLQKGNRLTQYDKLIGTLEYMSPEQILGKDVTAASDIYALGILLFEMLTGRAPFVADTEYEIMKSQVELPPPSPLEFKNDLPQKLADIILRTLAKDPTERYSSVKEFSSALSEIHIDINDAKSELNKIIQNHQLSRENTVDYNKFLPEMNLDAPKRDIEKKNARWKEQIIFSLRSIIARLLSVLVQKEWLGPLILIISLVILGGILLQAEYPEKPDEQIVMDSSFDQRISEKPGVENMNPTKLTISHDNVPSDLGSTVPPANRQIVSQSPVSNAPGVASQKEKELSASRTKDITQATDEYKEEVNGWNIRKGKNEQSSKLLTKIPKNNKRLKTSEKKDFDKATETHEKTINEWGIYKGENKTKSE